MTSLLAISRATFNLGESADKTAFSVISDLSVRRILSASIKGIFVTAAVGSFIFLLIGGAQWIFAGGDKEGIDKAKKKITGALIGLAVTLSAYAIAQLSETIFGVNIFNLVIPEI